MQGCFQTTNHACRYSAHSGTYEEARHDFGRLDALGIAAMPQVLAVVSVLGKDQKGVVAQFATYMAERGINIEDIEQRVVRGFFVMDMLVDLKDVSVDLSEL